MIVGVAKTIMNGKGKISKCSSSIRVPTFGGWADFNYWFLSICPQASRTGNYFCWSSSSAHRTRCKSLTCNIHTTHFEQVVHRQREKLWCVSEEIITEQMLEKIRCPERESNPRLTDFMTGALPLSYRGNYSGMGWFYLLIFKHLPPDLSDWELLLLIVELCSSDPL